MGMSGISKSQVSRLCEEIDGKVKAFLDRPIEGAWPYLWIDATYVKVRNNGRIVSAAVIIAVGANADGRREVLGHSSSILTGVLLTPYGHRPVGSGNFLDGFPAKAAPARPARRQAGHLRRP